MAYTELVKKPIESIGYVLIHEMVHLLERSHSEKFIAGMYNFASNAILNKLRETRLDQFIIENVNKGSIHVGVSVGSIIAGPSIEIAGWGSEGDKNDIGHKVVALTNDQAFFLLMEI